MIFVDDLWFFLFIYIEFVSFHLYLIKWLWLELFVQVRLWQVDCKRVELFGLLELNKQFVCEVAISSSFAFLCQWQLSYKSFGLFRLWLVCRINFLSGILLLWLWQERCNSFGLLWLLIMKFICKSLILSDLILLRLWRGRCKSVGLLSLLRINKGLICESAIPSSVILVKFFELKSFLKFFQTKHIFLGFLSKRILHAMNA